jgi:uroporphyrin-3 C-methyltransferase
VQAEQLRTGHLGRVQAFFYQVWADIQNLITIERIDRPQAPLLTNEHRFYLKENLKLRLLSARIALLQHDQASYQADLTLVRQWLQQYYDMQHPNAIKALKLLNHLIENRVSLELPELHESLNAINRYKLSLENPH